MWRSEDQALLERLEDQEVFELLWRAEAPSAKPLHPRAAGLIQVLRQRRSGLAALAAIHRGDPAPLLAAVRPESMTGLPGPLLHHIAIYNARLAAACQHDPERVERARKCSLAAWIALAQQGSYLEQLARAVLGEDGDIQSAVEAAAIAPLDELGKQALSGARELSSAAGQALRTLTHVSDACRISGCSAVVAKRFERHAERLRARVIETALAPISEAISDATARGQAETEGALFMERVARVWGWADADEHVERFAVDVVTPIAWNVYHEENSDIALRRLIGPLDALVDRLAWRIQTDGSRIAYAAPCAQMYVFRSEIGTNAQERLRWAERSLEICPSHRNGRLILASLLVHEVRDRLDRSAMFMQGSDFHDLESKLARADELYPRTRGLDDLKEKVAQAREKSWWGR
jgi:hypothetical protein